MCHRLWKHFPRGIQETPRLASLGWVCRRLLRGRSVNFRANQKRPGSDPPVHLPKSLFLTVFGHSYKGIQTGERGLSVGNLFVKSNSSHLLNLYHSQELCPLHIKNHLIFGETQWERKDHPYLTQEGTDAQRLLNNRREVVEITRSGDITHTSQGPTQPFSEQLRKLPATSGHPGRQQNLTSPVIGQDHSHGGGIQFCRLGILFISLLSPCISL